VGGLLGGLGIGGFAAVSFVRRVFHVGTYSDLSDMTSFRTFVTALAGLIATEVARI
jgi:hypothetical protein